MQPTHPLSDSELIQAYLLGHSSCLETLIYRHKDKIYTSIFMLVKDQYLAEDIFQETFLKIIRTLNDGRYSEQGKFLPWAVRVAHNLCMDHFRKIRQDIPVVMEDGREIMQLMQFATESAESGLERRQVHRSVRQLIEELPEEQREVIVLRIYGDLSFKEIADITSVSINTALGRMRYGLINLRRMIAEKHMVLR
ncbi:MAG TPA: sigma-70 family RNA polymerase sigma factor [Flavipsychrobacter sp.]|nr:sigma-70 family RNA polymerase sigma factor [Flavipsychrobacter sp.]